MSDWIQGLRLRSERKATERNRSADRNERNVDRFIDAGKGFGTFLTDKKVREQEQANKDREDARLKDVFTRGEASKKYQFDIEQGIGMDPNNMTPKWEGTDQDIQYRTAEATKRYQEGMLDLSRAAALDKDSQSALDAYYDSMGAIKDSAELTGEYGGEGQLLSIFADPSKAEQLMKNFEEGLTLAGLTDKDLRATAINLFADYLAKEQADAAGAVDAVSGPDPGAEKPEARNRPVKEFFEGQQQAFQEEVLPAVKGLLGGGEETEALPLQDFGEFGDTAVDTTKSPIQNVEQFLSSYTPGMLEFQKKRAAEELSALLPSLVNKALTPEQEAQINRFLTEIQADNTKRGELTDLLDYLKRL